VNLASAWIINAQVYETTK